MDEHILAKMEEMVDKELSKYIKPSNDHVEVKSRISFVEMEKVSEANPPDWMKPFPVHSKQHQ